jgi:curved DNA-binding protein CbpA
MVRGDEGRQPDCLTLPPRAALLHPDRHRDPALKPAADARFAALQRAYEILCDPAKRAIYDEFGESGLKTQWEVSTKGKTPAEVRAPLRGNLSAPADRVFFATLSSAPSLNG